MSYKVQAIPSFRHFLILQGKGNNSFNEFLLFVTISTSTEKLFGLDLPVEMSFSALKHFFDKIFHNKNIENCVVVFASFFPRGFQVQVFHFVQKQYVLSVFQCVIFLETQSHEGNQTSNNCVHSKSDHILIKPVDALKFSKSNFSITLFENFYSKLSTDFDMMIFRQ